MLTEVLATVSFLAAITPVPAPDLAHWTYLPDLAYWTYLPGFAAASSVAGPAGTLYFLSESAAQCTALPSFIQSQPVVSVFVGKLASDGRKVEWTFCRQGASGALAADDSRNLYVATNAGTSSTVTKLAPDGATAVYAATIPAASVTAMAVDSAGNVYVTGSASAGFPTTFGVYRTACAAAVCGFAAKLGRTGAMVFATYIPADGYAIAVDSRGWAWITGTSMISAGPIVPHHSYSSGGVHKLDAEGKTLLVNQSFGGGSSTARGFNGGAK